MTAFNPCSRAEVCNHMQSHAINAIQWDCARAHSQLHRIFFHPTRRRNAAAAAAAAAAVLAAAAVTSSVPAGSPAHRTTTSVPHTHRRAQTPCSGTPHSVAVAVSTQVLAECTRCSEEYTAPYRAQTTTTRGGCPSHACVRVRLCVCGTDAAPRCAGLPGSEDVPPPLPCSAVRVVH